MSSSENGREPESFPTAFPSRPILILASDDAKSGLHMPPTYQGAGAGYQITSQPRRWLAKTTKGCCIDADEGEDLLVYEEGDTKFREHRTCEGTRVEGGGGVSVTGDRTCVVDRGVDPLAFWRSIGDSEC